MEHQHSHRYRKSKNMAGKLITILQLILSAALLIQVWNSGMVPNLYLALMGAGLFLLFAITFFLQYIRNGVRYLGIVISLLISIGLAIGIFAFLRVQKTMEEVGGATYKTDNMIVVVKKDDLAQNLLDTGNYRLGVQTAVDQENTQLMREDVESAVDRELLVVEYPSIQEEAQGLLICVEDTGCGIAPKVQQRMFEQGFSTKGEGRGTGLALVQSIVQAYGGDVRVESVVGLGTTFTIHIPPQEENAGGPHEKEERDCTKS